MNAGKQQRGDMNVLITLKLAKNFDERRTKSGVER
jgi:hypothetical protein